MKLWYHLLAAIVGFAIAALIVWWVFGHASEEGATQEGSAGALGAAETLCGTISPAEGTSESARAKAKDNLPVLADESGPIPAISADKPDQQAWFERVQAASGFCIDEIKVEQQQTTITMSTVESVSEEDAGEFAAGALAQAFAPPLQRAKVTIVTTVGEDDRTVTISSRAWKAFEVARKSRSLPLDMHTLAQFRQTTSFGAQDLRVVGWR